MIGLIGAHRTGKTTLARAFSEETGITFAETSSSAVFKELGFDPQKDYDFKVRLFIQNRILDAAEAVYKASGVHYITDRTPLDMLAYTMADIQRSNLDTDDSAMFVDYLERCFEVTNRHFASLIVIQPGIPLVDDKDKAPCNMAYMEHINSLAMGLVVDKRNNTGRHFIPKWMINHDERMAAVRNSVDAVYDRFNKQAVGENFH